MVTAWQREALWRGERDGGDGDDPRTLPWQSQGSDRSSSSVYACASKAIFLDVSRKCVCLSSTRPINLFLWRHHSNGDSDYSLSGWCAGPMAH